MAGIVVLGIILLLALVLFTPLAVRVIREEAGLLVWLHIGPVRRRLYPPERRMPPQGQPAGKAEGTEKKEKKKKAARRRKA